MLDNAYIQMCLKKNRNKYHRTDNQKHQDLQEKLNFLSDFYTEVVNGEFDEEITAFLAGEISKAEARKKVNSAKRREKKRKEREASKQRTLEAAKSLIQDVVNKTIPETGAGSADTPRYMQI